ncbi:Hypothetical predicted protein [Paramuricea clavata]|uniref:Uncharacterized protein n=1 Tax=Paramuricea clavata TaxID=317549 RepID=A0A7D9IQC3_PARCT|nr:Hypothetical predicted protein [Paramuricea clavata]
MDTDSAYIAISGENIEELVKPELRDEFETDKSNWFPHTDSVENARYDKRNHGYSKWNGKERDTRHYFERFSEDDNFDGVTLQELPELDKLFELEDKEETKLVAQLIAYNAPTVPMRIPCT